MLQRHSAKINHVCVSARVCVCVKIIHFFEREKLSVLMLFSEYKKF